VSKEGQQDKRKKAQHEKTVHIDEFWSKQPQVSFTTRDKQNNKHISEGHSINIDGRAKAASEMRSQLESEDCATQRRADLKTETWPETTDSCGILLATCSVSREICQHRPAMSMLKAAKFIFLKCASDALCTFDVFCQWATTNWHDVRSHGSCTIGGTNNKNSNIVRCLWRYRNTLIRCQQIQRYWIESSLSTNPKCRNRWTIWRWFLL
jgi:hypothetical protein